jgi:hypothetical protein
MQEMLLDSSPAFLKNFIAAGKGNTYQRYTTIAGDTPKSTKSQRESISAPKAEAAWRALATWPSVEFNRSLEFWLFTPTKWP